MKCIFIITFWMTVHICITNSQVTISGITSGQNDFSGDRVYYTNCDTIFSFSTKDQYSVGLAFDGSLLYSCGVFRHIIYKYELNGQIVDSIPLPSSTFGGSDMDFDGTYLWLVVEQEARIYKIDPSSGEVIMSLALPTIDQEDPDHFGCAYDDGYIWITEYTDETLLRINAKTGELVDSFDINRKILPLKIIDGELFGIEFNYFPERSYRLVKFDKGTGAVIDSFAWCIDNPLGFTSANDHVWGLSSLFGTQRIYQLNYDLTTATTANNSIREQIRVFPNPASTKVIVSSSGIIHNIELLNTAGHIVYAATRIHILTPYEIDLSCLSKGVYFVRIFGDSELNVEKLIVK